MKKVIVFCSLFFLLTGCWDKNEIEENAFVIAIGVDQAKKPQNIKITYLIANPPVGLPQAGGDREPAEQVMTFTAPDYITARDLANATETRKMNFSHAKAIIVGSKFAKTDKFYKYMRGSIRDVEIRREINLMISKEDASTFLQQNDPQLETRPHKYYDMMATRWKETGLSPNSTLQKYFEKFEGGDDAFLGIYASTEQSNTKKKENEESYVAGQIAQQGGNKTQMIGSAVIKNGKMVGTLTGRETRLAQNLGPKALAKYMYVTFPDPIDPKYRIATRLTHVRKSTVKINTNKDPMSIQLKIPLEVYIAQITSGVNYVTNMENQTLLKKALEADIEKLMMNLVKKSQTKYQIDLFDWSLVARHHFLTRKAFEQYNWIEKYPNADVHITVELKIEGFGNELRPPTLKTNS